MGEVIRFKYTTQVNPSLDSKTDSSLLLNGKLWEQTIEKLHEKRDALYEKWNLDGYVHEVISKHIKLSCEKQLESLRSDLNK